MSSACSDVQERFADDGVDGLDDAQRAHFDGCENCRRIAGTLERLDQAFLELSTPEAPAVDVAARSREAKSARPRVAFLDWGRRLFDVELGSAVAALVVLVVLFGVTKQNSTTMSDLTLGSGNVDRGAEGGTEGAFADDGHVDSEMEITVENDMPVIDTTQAAVAASIRVEEVEALPEGRNSTVYWQQIEGVQEKDLDAADMLEPNKEAAVKNERFRRDKTTVGGRLERRALRKASKLKANDAAIAESEEQQILAERQLDDNLTFQLASGYWANTYVPGDPAIRILESRLLSNAAAGPVRLDLLSRPYRQPFDPPTTAALAVYLHADRKVLRGRERMLVQVGISGTPRSTGLRPAMNIGLVLDLRQRKDPRIGSSMRALVRAFESAKQAGDRFSIVVAGPSGGIVVTPEAFRRGAVDLAIRSLFGRRPDYSRPAVGLVQAVEQAMALVAAGDDPASPLGASVVLLATGSSLRRVTDRLVDLAHTSAVDGIPLSTVAVGSGVDLANLDRITLAGQGNRRLLGSPDEAVAVVDRELHAAGAAIARAVRLRIRLAPGVHLIDVIGSHALEEQAAERVREAETSIDRRIAKSMGITADRGEDEEGIQIVIPSFYAGDSHVILLDVVADRPGSIADVTVRYKDLVYLGNGIARANLTVPAGQTLPGLLERNVLKNLVASRLAAASRRAGAALHAGDAARAIREVEALLALLARIQDEVSAWRNDAEIVSDAEMLNEYLVALRADEIVDPTRRAWLADSMSYAGHRKLHASR